MNGEESKSTAATSKKQTNTSTAPKVETDTCASRTVATTNQTSLERGKNALSPPAAPQLSNQPVISVPSASASHLDVSEVGFGESAASKFKFNPHGTTTSMVGGSNPHNKTGINFKPFTFTGMPSRDTKNIGMSNMSPSMSQVFPLEQVRSKDSPIPSAVPKLPPPTLKAAVSVRISETKAIEFGSKTVTVHVGVDISRTTFTVHENILRARSTYWEAILSKDDQRILTLTEVDAKTFALYMQLICTGYIPSKHMTPGVIHNDAEYSHLCKLYLFTYKYKDLEAQNMVIDVLHATSQEAGRFGKDATYAIRDASLPPRQCVELIYDSTSEGSGARRLLIDLYAYKGHGKWMRDEKEPFSPEFMSDLALELLETRILSHSRIMRNSQFYHEIAPGKKD